MPFIEEEKFKLMQEDLDNSKLKREEAENELSQVQEEYDSFKKKSKIIPIVLGLLLGASLAATYYFYTNNGGSSFSSTDEIATIKKNEALRVLDSVKRAQARAKRKARAQAKSGDAVNTNNDESTSNSSLDISKAASDVSKKTSGKTIYSVQIGVFSKRNHPLLSSKTIPSTVTSSDGYFKYSIGLFSTLKEAKKLQRELVKVGFDDAFVASYINGKRQKIHN
ncbi:MULTISPECIES: SPOR domain-containing protein [Tenacibaculum]|uniref:SPOR domain-containing protein n=1 Tax=Tenacibaculum TaxID=104267 RepID=UPI001F28321E|nr:MULTISPECIES: SPOR domain-containing protein [Tenacibaculum]MCF2873856.1 SPOR domain-containing protein [Tenacibaculum sp. Cn5-1]MCF2936666.1 SPOR domain-containing protein [Tenacibaculum sp. Cn5-34]MCG7512890.1 SPOR domain-containing protein [Tenacibaculum sp. Cn5-46]